MAQLLVIVEVFIAQGQGIETLSYQGVQCVVATGSAARITDGLRHRAGQPDTPIHLAQQHGAAIAGDITPAEFGFNPATFYTWKFEGSLVTFCHGGFFF